MLYLFDKNEKLIHELASNELESLIQHEELNKLMTLEFSVFIDSNDKMKDIEYVAHKDMEDYQKIQMYRLISSESDDYTVNYQAVHIIFDELKAYGYIRDKRPDKVKASAALNIALAGSRWKVGKVDDSQLLSTNFYDCTRLDALSKIIKTWNLDLHFYLTFDGNKITGRYIDLLGFRGEDTGERFVYGSNALEVVKEVDVSDVYTRVIPRGKGEEKVDEEGKPTDGYGRRIKIDDVLWEKSKGDPVDKPKGQEFLELKEMTEKFGFSDGEPRTRVQIFEDIEDPKELIKAGYDFLVKVSRPLVQFKTKISKRSRTNVGDIVRIIRKDLDFYYRTRIYKAHRNLLNETLEVEFGDKLVQSPADRQKIVSDSLNSLEERIKETETDLKSSFVDKVNEGITHATFNRDGYNYELKKGNKYGLPAGYYSFDREIDDNPQRVIYVGAGTLAIADSKKSNGDWDFRTFGTGQGFVADLLVAGTILGGKVRWNLEDGTLLIGENTNNYNLFWDGQKLSMKDVEIDLSNNGQIMNLENKLNNTNTRITQTAKEISTKISKNEIISEINQSPEQVKIRANKIDLEGSAVNIKGTLQTLNSTDDIGIKIDYNQIHFQDNRRQGYRFGMINVNKLWYKDRAFSLNLGHYQEGFLSVGWYKDDWKEWEPYMVFDRWGKSTYATEGYSIRVLDTINFDKTALFKGNVVINNSTTFNDECKFERNITFGGNRIKIVNYSDGLGFVNGNGEGLFIEGSGAVYLMDTQYKYRVAKE